MPDTPTNAAVERMGETMTREEYERGREAGEIKALLRVLQEDVTETKASVAETKASIAQVAAVCPQCQARIATLETARQADGQARGKLGDRLWDAAKTLLPFAAGFLLAHWK